MGHILSTVIGAPDKYIFVSGNLLPSMWYFAQNIICISKVDQEFLFVVLFSVLSFIQT